jgi:DNA repair protein RadD
VEKKVSGPGLSFRKHIATLPENDLKALFDPNLLALFNLMNKSQNNDANLASLAKELLDPRDIIIDSDRRNILIRNLSKNKITELAERVDLDPSATLIALYKQCSTPIGIQKTLAFFGIEVGSSKNEGEVACKKIMPSYSLFEYQRNVCDEALEILDSGHHTVLLHLPTGGGKTRSAMHIVCRHLIRHSPSVVFWLAQSRELLDQAADEFERAWSTLGDRPLDLVRFWGSADADPTKVSDGVVVAGLQKLHQFKRGDLNQFLKLADRAHLTVVDEAHVALAPTYRDLITGLCTKRRDNRLLGLTATPGRTWSDVAADRELAELFQGQKVTISVEGYPDPISFLTAEGYLASPTFKLLNGRPGLALSNAEMKALANEFEVPDSALIRLGDDPVRNLSIVKAIEELIQKHKRIIVFAPSVASAKAIAALLRYQGHQALCVTGETPAHERRMAISAYRSNHESPIVMCNYGVLTTGFDAPQTSAALIARPTLSLVLYSQMVGRALRGPRAGGNKEAEIVTVVDPELPGFGKIEEAFRNWEDVWNGSPT